jgi:hypothetical protein
MIRRWSSINLLFSSDLNYYWPFRIGFYYSVKKHIRFKKFVILYTRRKRKKATRRKKIKNYVQYSQILAHWAIDYRDKKSIFRYQFFFFISDKSIFSFDPLLHRKPALNLEENYDIRDWITTTIPPKLFKFLFKTNDNFFKFKIWKANSSSIMFFLSNVESLPTTTELNEGSWMRFYDNLLLPVETNTEIDIPEFFFLNLEIMNVNMNVELYKIITLLWYFKIYNASTGDLF